MALTERLGLELVFGSDPADYERINANNKKIDKGVSQVVHTHVAADIIDLVNASESVGGIIRRATSAAALQGEENTTSMSPAKTKLVADGVENRLNTRITNEANALNIRINNEVAKLNTKIDAEISKVTNSIFQQVDSILPIGVIFPMFTGQRPSNAGRMKFIELTHNAEGGYNNGLLETVEFPNVGSGSPHPNTWGRILVGTLAGQGVRLLNTEKRYIRAGGLTAENHVYDDKMRNITGNFADRIFSNNGINGVFYGVDEWGGVEDGSNNNNTITRKYFDASRQVPTGNEINPRTHEFRHFMRIV